MYRRQLPCSIGPKASLWLTAGCHLNHLRRPVEYPAGLIPSAAVRHLPTLTQRDRPGNERCGGSDPDLGGLFASWRRQMSVFICVGLVGARRSAGSEIPFPTGKENFDVEDVQGTLNIGQSTHSLHGVPPPTALGLVRQ